MSSNKQLFIQKYQPIFLSDFEIDNEIIELLKTFILIDNLNILLIGKIASCKTSLLNSIIKEYYIDSSSKDISENVLFINSLKEQGINYYRNDVKIFCQTCSVIKNKKKIVVLDDIDFINEQSQQVFRNCIDKYSNNVHFISSCSNIQKVIESLQSRLNIIKIKNLNKQNLINLINKIKEKENIEIDPDAEEFIINISNNTVKILINYMEKFKLVKEKITLNLAILLCSNINFFIFDEYTKFIKDKNIVSAIKLIYDVYDKYFLII